MAKARTSTRSSFDLDKLKELVELMENHGVMEVTLRRGDEEWSLRRGPDPAAPPPAVAAAAPVAPPPAVASAAPPAATEESDDFAYIASPTVGTFYAAPSPDDAPFVARGSRVEPDTTVCIVEAMKVFNQITADVSGSIVDVLVNNGDAVEFGQRLFKVRR